MSKRYKAFILICISLMLISNLNQLWGCAWSEDVDIVNMSLFNDQLMAQDDLRIYLPSFHYYYGGSGDDLPIETTEKQQNIDEWFAHFKGKYSKAQIDEILYTYSDSALLSFINTQTKAMQHQFNYLLSVRMADDSVNDNVNTWWYEKKQPKNFQPLIESAQHSYKTEHDKYLKYRYGYLVQKLLHAAGKYAESATWYEKNLAVADITGTMKYRTLDYYAGALYHLKNYAKSNYLFSRIFDEYPARKFRSYTSFVPQEENDWQGSLALAKNDHERETMWFLFGLHGDIIKAIQKIYAINPSSRYLEVLVTRGVKMIENSTPEIWIFTGEQPYGAHDSFSIQEIYGSEYTVTSNQKAQLAGFITEHANDARLKNGWLWATAAAYLKIMTHQNKEAELLLKEAEKSAGNNAVKLAQTNDLELVLLLKTNLFITPAVENKLMDLLAKIPAKRSYAESNAFRFCMQVLKQDFLRQGDSLRAALCDANDLQFYHDNQAKKLAFMETFFKQENLSAFDNFLVNHYTYNIHQLIYAEGIIKFYAGDLKGAANDFVRSEHNLENLPADPFSDHIVDCHDCDQLLAKKVNYTLPGLVNKMIEIEQLAKTAKDSALRSKNYMLLANAFYNTGYFGNNRYASYNFLFVDQNLLSGYDRAANYRNYTNYTEAEKYYSLAVDYATTAENKAHACWMIAKCRLNESYVFNGDSAQIQPVTDSYKMMKDKYYNTQYYQEVINECGYFTAYLGLPSKTKKE